MTPLVTVLRVLNDGHSGSSSSSLLPNRGYDIVQARAINKQTNKQTNKNLVTTTLHEPQPRETELHPASSRSIIRSLLRKFFKHHGGSANRAAIPPHDGYPRTVAQQPAAVAQSAVGQLLKHPLVHAERYTGHHQRLRGGAMAWARAVESNSEQWRTTVKEQGVSNDGSNGAGAGAGVGAGAG